MDGRSRGVTARMVCHCLVVETEVGLILVDTGLGLRDVAAPRKRLSRLFKTFLRPRLDSRDTAVRQLE